MKRNWTIHKKPSKMKNKPQRVDSITFDSIKEANYYVSLKQWQAEGKVIMFLRQPIFDLGGGTTYRADFQVFWSNGTVEFIDVKGRRLPSYIKAKKQTEARYPVTITEV
jgi:hypothetical protein